MGISSIAQHARIQQHIDGSHRDLDCRPRAEEMTNKNDAEKHPLATVFLRRRVHQTTKLGTAVPGLPRPQKARVRRWLVRQPREQYSCTVEERQPHATVVNISHTGEAGDV